MEAKDSAQEAMIQSEPKQRWYHIDTAMIPAKVAYFFYGFKEGAYMPYINLFFIDVGLSPSQAGLVTGLRYIGALLGAICWSMVSDWSRKPRLVLVVVTVSLIGVLLPQPWLPTLLASDNPCHPNQTASQNATYLGVGGCERSDLFFKLLCFNIIICFFDGYIQPFIDSSVVTQIQTSTRKADIGNQKFFFSFGFCIASVSVSAIIECLPKSFGISKFSVQYFLYAGAVLMILIDGNFLINKKNSSGKDSKVENDPQKSDGVAKALMSTVLNFEVIFFLLTCLLLGALFGMYANFLLVMMREQNPPNIVLGLTIAVGSTAGFLMFPIATRFIKAVGGPMEGMTISCLANVVRMFVYGYADSPYVLMAANITNGFTLTIFLVAAIIHTEAVSPKQILTSMCGVVNGTIWGAGMMTANIFGGLAYQRWGGSIMYRGAGIITSIWTVFMVIFILCKRLGKQKSAQETTLIGNDTDDSSRLPV